MVHMLLHTTTYRLWMLGRPAPPPKAMGAGDGDRGRLLSHTSPKLDLTGGAERAPGRSAATWALGASTSGLLGDRIREILRHITTGSLYVPNTSLSAAQISPNVASALTE